MVQNTVPSHFQGATNSFWVHSSGEARGFRHCGVPTSFFNLLENLFVLRSVIVHYTMSAKNEQPEKQNGRYNIQSRHCIHVMT